MAELPKSPGVYLYKDSKGEIIYVGKAAVLRNRVRQYFQKSRSRDPKTEALVAEIVDLDLLVVDSELDALFLEAELVRRYMPRYNILLRDDKSMVYIRIDYDSDYPTVSTTRRPLDDGARYYGPYLSALGVRQALKLLRRVFPYATKRTPNQKRASLHYHIGLDPGLEDGKTSLKDYRANLRRLIAVIEGKRKSIEKQLEKDMNTLAKASKFEEAAIVRNQLFALRRLNQQVIFSDKEFLDISKDQALSELVELLGLKSYPKRVEGYDISHQQGSDVVASMVVFTNGATNKSEYRKFKTRINKNDDFYNMHETIARRFNVRGPSSNGSGKSKGAWKMNLPDLVLIDGGKGQLDAAIRARNETLQGATLQSKTTDENRTKNVLQGATLKVSEVPFIGLAKREEQIVVKKPSKVDNLGSGVVVNQAVVQKLGGFMTESNDFILINLPHNTNLVKLLQRIRDESHRFAVSYHSVLKTKRQTKSLLEEIPGVGPATKRKLLRKFGSVKGIRLASTDEIATISGTNRALLIKQHLAD